MNISQYKQLTYQQQRLHSLLAESRQRSLDTIPLHRSSCARQLRIQGRHHPTAKPPRRRYCKLRRRFRDARSKPRTHRVTYFQRNRRAIRPRKIDLRGSLRLRRPTSRSCFRRGRRRGGRRYCAGCWWLDHVGEYGSVPRCGW